VIFDDIFHCQHPEDSCPFDGFMDPRFAGYDFYVALGYRHLARKSRILQELRAAGRRVPSFVHASCYIHPSCRISDGCLVYPMCNLDQEVELAPGVLLNNSVVVSHNSRLGEAAYCSPGVVLSGHVTVGDEAFLGSGALVANNRRIGRGARIGIGTVVTSDVPESASAIGNPMRVLERPLELE
jgi:acetyltransferase-like isoleucine patch superfamily enzyme